MERDENGNVIKKDHTAAIMAVTMVCITIVVFIGLGWSSSQVKK